MPHVAITAIGADRPGIVAALTEALREVGGNLEDVSSTILRGHFTMMLVVDLPEGVTSRRVEERLVGSAEPLGVSITVRDVESGVGDRPARSHVLSVYGADHPGIVAGFARLLADRGVNIADMSCRLVGKDRPVFTMIAEVSVPETVDPGELDAAVRGMAEELEVDVSFEAAESETF